MTGAPILSAPSACAGPMGIRKPFRVKFTAVLYFRQGARWDLAMTPFSFRKVMKKHLVSWTRTSSTRSAIAPLLSGR